MTRCQCVGMHRSQCSRSQESQMPVTIPATTYNSRLHVPQCFVSTVPAMRKNSYRICFSFAQYWSRDGSKSNLFAVPFNLATSLEEGATQERNDQSTMRIASRARTARGKHLFVTVISICWASATALSTLSCGVDGRGVRLSVRRKRSRLVNNRIFLEILGKLTIYVQKRLEGSKFLIERVHVNLEGRWPGRGRVRALTQRKCWSRYFRRAHSDSSKVLIKIFLSGDDTCANVTS